MRSFAPTVDLRANNNGELQLMSVSDLVRVQTQWHGLKNPKTSESVIHIYILASFLGITDYLHVRTQPVQGEGEGTGEETNGPEGSPPDPKDFISVNVSVRAFLKFLSSHVLNSATIASTFLAIFLIPAFMGAKA